MVRPQDSAAAGSYASLHTCDAVNRIPIICFGSSVCPLIRWALVLYAASCVRVSVHSDGHRGILVYVRTSFVPTRDLCHCLLLPTQFVPVRYCQCELEQLVGAAICPPTPYHHVAQNLLTVQSLDR